MAKSDYLPIGDYALIADCHSAALVSRHGSIDWCCMPRFDDGSSFGRLLDHERGGYFQIAPADGDYDAAREYVDGSLVLVTSFRTGGGDVRVIDCFTMREGGRRDPYQQLLRTVECDRGHVEMNVRFAPRFDYGSVHPWLRMHEPRVYSAVGGDDGLVLVADTDLELHDQHDLAATFELRASQRVRFSMTFVHPELIEDEPPKPHEADELDRRLDSTIEWWRHWSESGRGVTGPEHAGVLRSATVLKGLTFARTGAIAAAPTTSLPEVAGGSRNWDYRFSWIRDSAFSVRALAELGFSSEADGFRRFVQRSSAGSVQDLQIVYGVGGERRLDEVELDLDGWRGSRPVRAGNGAAGQLQLDAYGELLNLAWRWHERGHSPDDDLWRFLVDIVNAAAERWEEPDCGIWEWRDDRKHFVHSKALCWAALDRGIKLAEECMRRAPTRRWAEARDAVREAIETKGFDSKRGTFVQAFGSKELDAAALILPMFDFIAYDDERMVSTVDAVREELERDGLLMRYRTPDNLDGEEGCFLACSFWLVECLARQDRVGQAQDVFDRTLATANDVGLFGEEFEPRSGEILGNFPQCLTHLAHIAAAVALQEARTAGEGPLASGAEQRRSA